MIRPILQVPDPVLRRVSEPVYALDKELRALAGDMLDTMRKYHGLGLAAVQVGVPVRMIAVSQSVCPFAIMVNPVIVRRSQEMVASREGCFSIDFGKTKFGTKRHREVAIEFKDRADQQHSIVLRGLSAFVIQHEIDHLDGKLVG
jgi:peptide deformylase